MWKASFPQAALSCQLFLSIDNVHAHIVCCSVITPCSANVSEIFPNQTLTCLSMQSLRLNGMQYDYNAKKLYHICFYKKN